MTSPRTTLWVAAATVAALASPGFAFAQSDPNLTSVESDLLIAPVLMYSFGTDAAWSADGSSSSFGGCSGFNGNPGQASASGNCTGTADGATAGASADLGPGTLSASASTPAITSFGGAAGALMWTTLIFSGAGSNATGTFELPLTGSFTNGGIGVAGLAVNPSSNWITDWTTVDSSNSSPTLSVSFSIVNGAPTKFAAGLGVDAVWNGNSVSASLDPPWTLILPAGVTYGSYNGDPTIPGGGSGGGGGIPAPEPGSLSLMLLGLVLTASAAVRMRASRAHD
jgi:hypothetical protein